MWKQLWKKWTIDKPAAFGDLLWEVFVVQFAAFLDRLTWRRIVALIPLAILAVAYAHSVPLPPELMLIGDVLAYIDIVSVILLLSIMSRAAAILFVVKQAAEQAIDLARSVLAAMQRLDFRHRRARGAKRNNPSIRRADSEDDDHAVVLGVAWA
ncbi:hypothetical protein [Bradyrhizobium sp.]|uniref:hypothetical protein n=1 Tax=Bradyrhizobium sp. TaxID=376 RepID=UPI0025BD8B54|nr:hypothetical protein [Bradyrhizobium sp.]MBV8923262.1 hypothetical protein [Bradyrhizobium sp.]